MKRRRTAIVAFLLVAVLTIGVGYAALNDTLYVSGTAKASSAEADKAFDNAVYFVAPEVDDDAGYTVTVQADNNGDANDLAIVNVTGLIEKDDELTITIPIQNDSQYVASLSLTKSGETIQDAGEDAFELTYSIPNTVAAGGTVDVTITIKLLATPHDADISASFSFDIDAVAQE